MVPLTGQRLAVRQAFQEKGLAEMAATETQVELVQLGVQRQQIQGQVVERAGQAPVVPQQAELEEVDR
jgi:hypothetical protein